MFLFFVFVFGFGFAFGSVSIASGSSTPGPLHTTQTSINTSSWPCPMNALFIREPIICTSPFFFLIFIAFISFVNCLFVNLLFNIGLGLYFKSIFVIAPSGLTISRLVSPCLISSNSAIVIFNLLAMFLYSALFL